jgi:hypothetical protein
MWKLTLGYGYYIVNVFFFYKIAQKNYLRRERILCAKFVPLMKTTTRMTVQRNKDPRRPIVPTPPFFFFGLLALLAYYQGKKDIVFKYSI